MIRVYDDAGNVMQTHEHAGDFKECERYCRLRPPVRAERIDDFINLPQPTRWNTGASRTFKYSDKEGTMVEVRAFVLAVKAERGESCNCELTGKLNTVHIALVRDAEEEDENNSITAEITPRLRHSGHPDWTYANLKDLEGNYVKVVGQLMLDTKHIPQASKLPGEKRTNKRLTRATNWEVHPITALWVCTKSKHACDHGSGWKAVP